MRCVSTRAPGGPGLSLLSTLATGTAPDGGLFVPERLPAVTGVPSSLALADVAAWLLAPYFEHEQLELEAVCQAAFTFEAPVTALGADHLLELFWGPTAAFKDFGARFLAECLARSGVQATVLVATSGDTGAAVAAAFHRRPGFKVVVLYPRGRVSARQAHQLGAFGENITALEVDGSFDDCQRMVKAAFADRELSARLRLASANSISLGRILPQMAYYARAAIELERQGLGPANFVVPTGNLGNGLACVMARQMGLPIGQVVLATNANRVLPDSLLSGSYAPRASVATLANAMDVGAPSNLERLRFWFVDPATAVSADWVDDEQIRPTIRETFDRTGVVVCPHTACAVAVMRRLRARGATGSLVVAATAHPAKFDTVVEPIIGRSVPVPPALAALLERPAHATPLAATDQALQDVLRQLQQL